MIILLVLLGIILLAIIVGCLKVLKDRRSNQDSSVPRLLLGVRERVRGGIRTLEDRLGFRLWPGGKRGGEDEEEGEGEGEEGARKRDVEAGGGGEGGRDKDEEEEGDSSDDYSSLEGIDLKERAKNREEEEVKEKQKKEEAEERRGESVGGQGGVERGSDGKGEGGEETVPAVSAEENNERDVCHVTVL